MNGPRIFLGTSWKMNKTVSEALEFAQRLPEVLGNVSGLEEIQLFVIPPFTAIEAVKRASAGRFWVGAQNMHWAEWGAFTGEISAPMLQELGVDLVELGHAERRQHFNESDESVQRKVHTALRHGLRSLVCIGEQSSDREFGVEKEVIVRQLRVALSGVPPECAARLMVAYEPVWAIGEEGTPASPADVRVMSAHIRDLLEDTLGAEAALVPVLYGGTVNPENAAELLLGGRTDGLFVGRAAWQAEGFARLIANCAEAISRQRSGDLHENRVFSS
jgi:L-erythrulose 1-phosphate isomerase